MILYPFVARKRSPWSVTGSDRKQELMNFTQAQAARLEHRSKGKFKFKSRRPALYLWKWSITTHARLRGKSKPTPPTTELMTSQVLDLDLVDAWPGWGVAHAAIGT